MVERRTIAEMPTELQVINDVCFDNLDFEDFEVNAAKMMIPIIVMMVI